MDYRFICQPISNGTETIASEILVRELKADRTLSLDSSSVLSWAIESPERLQQIDMDALEMAIASPKHLPHHVNISPATVGSWDYYAKLGRAYKDGVDPKSLILEVSEFLDPTSEIARSWLASVKCMGFPIVLDDFGNCHSNNRALSLFRPDGIKIDGAIVRGIADSYNRGLIKKDLQFCLDYELSCVAEHVENKWIYEALVGLCDRIGYHDLQYQGWLFGKGELCQVG